MGFIGRLFGTEAALTSVVDGVKNGLDALVYTDQEKAADAAIERSEGRKMVVEWMKATQGQNLSRRLIALSITGVWLGMKILATLVAIYAVYSTDTARLQIVIELMRGLSSDMTNAVMLILGFYFAAPHMGGIAKAVMGRFEKQAGTPEPVKTSTPARAPAPVKHDTDDSRSPDEEP